jgi:uncharacterized protein YcfL
MIVACSVHAESGENDDRAVLWSTDKAIATISSLSTLLSDLVSDALVALLCLTHNATYIYIILFFHK